MSGKKQRDAAAEEAERQAKKKAAADADQKEDREAFAEDAAQEETDTQDLFGDKDNEDVIF